MLKVNTVLFTPIFSKLLIIKHGQKAMQLNVGNIDGINKPARWVLGQCDAEGNVSEMPEEEVKMGQSHFHEMYLLFSAVHKPQQTRNERKGRNVEQERRNV